MALTHVTKVFAVSDCKIAKMTADTASTATYSSSVDLPGVKSIGPLTQAMNPKYLKGDATLLDADVIVSEPWTGKVVGAKVSFDVEAVLLGATATDAGTTPNQTVTLTQTGGVATTATVPNYFKLEAVALGEDLIGGDYHLILWKCKISSANFIGFADEDYALYDFDIVSLPRLYDGNWFSRVLHETAVAAS